MEAKAGPRGVPNGTDRARESSQNRPGNGFLRRDATMSTTCPHCQQIFRVRRRGVLELSRLSMLCLRSISLREARSSPFGWSLTGNVSHWYQAILRNKKRIELLVLRKTNALVSLLRSQVTRRAIASVPIQYTNKKKILLIKEDTPLPSTVSMESEVFLPGWRVVRNLDRQALTRRVEEAHWNFSYLAGEIRATVFWHQGLGALRRATKCVLATQEQQDFKFNSLEITTVASKRFLGIPRMSVTAHSRHIQQGVGLAPRKTYS